MALPTNAPVFERAQLIQRDLVGGLPPLNLSNSPKLGTFCRLNNGQLWLVVVDDLAPPNLLKWELVNGGGGTVLPDQRFTVGREGYALQDPGVATFTTVAAGVAAARAGTATTLGNASAASQRLTWVMPDTYAEAALVLRSYVHLQGGGPAAAATVLSGTSITVGDAEGIIVIRDMRFDDCDFNIAPVGQPNLTLIFENCEFGACGWASNAPAGGTLNVFFNGCTGSITTSADVVGGGTKLTRVFSGTGANSADPARGLTFAATPTIGGSGQADVIITQGQYFYAVPTVNSLLLFTGTITGTVTTDDCTLETAPLSSVFGSTANGQAPATWFCRAGTRLTNAPRSYWRTTTSARFVGGQVEMLADAILGTQWPLDPVAGGTVTATLYPSNRERATQEFAFNVPPSQSAGGGPYADAAAAVAAMTVNGATTPFVDSYRITPSYADRGNVALDPDTANFGTTFRFASFLLPEPALLEDGRPYVVKNTSNPASDTAGPVALRLPNGSPSRVDYLQSDASVNGVFDLTNYVILEPGQSVVIEVDRKGANAPCYLVTAVVDALPGTPTAVDQRFTVAPEGYLLNAPGVNTWLTPEDGIAAAFAGTGTTLPPVSGAEQRFVWIHPALYDGLQAAVALHAWVHLVGCADGAEAAILQNYEFTLSESGDLTISGLYFSNCTFVFSGEGKIRFRNCRFELCSLSHASNDAVNYIFDNCQGTIPTWTVDATGLAAFSIIGSQQTSVGSFTPVLTLATTTIAMTVDGAIVELSLTGDVALDYSGTYLCDVTTGSAFQLVVDRAKLTSTGPKGFLFNIAGGTAQVGVNTRGDAILPQTQYVASTFDATSLLTLDYQQYSSEGNTLGQYWPTGVVGAGLVVQATNTGSRPRGFTGAATVTCVPGTALAAQTAAIGYGGFDRILASPNYAPLALNPNTASVNFQFASLLLIDPKNLPIGHTIDVVNDRTTAADQSNQVGGPIALRLPNGTTSRIGFMVSDVSVNPIFTSDNYVILEPGQSCTLTVSLDDISKNYRYNVSGIGADTNALTGLESQDGPLVESDWYVTTKDCWSLLGILPGFQGSNSSAGFAFMPTHSLLCSGARFYWASAAAGTVKVRIRSAAGAPLVDVDVPVNGIGDYTATFAAPLALTALTRYWITTYLTAGTGWTSGISGAVPARFLVAPQPMRGWVRLTGVCNSNGGGDVLPTASVLAESPMLLVPTFYR